MFIHYLYGAFLTNNGQRSKFFCTTCIKKGTVINTKEMK